MNRLLAFLLVLILTLVYGQDVCLPTWTALKDYRLLNGLNVNVSNSLEGCLGFCEYIVNTCVAVHFDPTFATPCWIHMQGSVNLTDLYTSAGSTLYTIQRNCTTLTTACSVQWETLVVTRSINGTQVNYWTQLDCFLFCQYSAGCVAIDFDITSSPPCSIHWSSNDLTPDNTDNLQTSTQYQLQKTCPSVLNDTKTISRCSGQYFPSSSLCDNSSVMNIVSVSLKSNPFCCSYIGANSTPPDGSSLPAYLALYLNSSYDSQVRAQCQNKTGCSNLLAKSFPYSAPVDGIQTDFCSGTFPQTNAVVITYRCSLNRQDIDECSLSNGGCNETCVNTVGSYFCSCSPKSTLASDKHSCVKNDSRKSEMTIKIMIGSLIAALMWNK